MMCCRGRARRTLQDFRRPAGTPLTPRFLPRVERDGSMSPQDSGLQRCYSCIASTQCARPDQTTCRCCQCPWWLHDDEGESEPHCHDASLLRSGGPFRGSPVSSCSAAHARDRRAGAAAAVAVHEAAWVALVGPLRSHQWCLGQRQQRYSRSSCFTPTARQTRGHDRLTKQASFIRPALCGRFRRISSVEGTRRAPSRTALKSQDRPRAASLHFSSIFHRNSRATKAPALFTGNFLRMTTVPLSYTVLPPQFICDH